MTTSTILRNAQARLTPERWGQSDFCIGKKECPHLAISEIEGHGAQHADVQRALGLFAAVVSGHSNSLDGVWFWNDVPGRTYRDVQEAFTAAIAIAESHESVAEALAATV